LRVDHRLRRGPIRGTTLRSHLKSSSLAPPVEAGRLVDPLDDLVEYRALGLHVTGRRHEHADQANDLAPK
jgi:hypothetical protein